MVTRGGGGGRGRRGREPILDGVLWLSFVVVTVNISIHVESYSITANLPDELACFPDFLRLLCYQFFMSGRVTVSVSVSFRCLTDLLEAIMLRRQTLLGFAV